MGGCVLEPAHCAPRPGESTPRCASAAAGTSLPPFPRRPPCCPSPVASPARSPLPVFTPPVHTA
eukprot:1302673-Prymnesium_polylepis.1